MLSFNIDHGFIDGIIRGYKQGLLNTRQYSTLSQCETLEDFRMQLLGTDYAPYFQQETHGLTTSTINKRCIDFYYDQFEFIRCNASGLLSKLLDYIRYSYMIDNVILLISGTLHERDMADLLPKCHPIGMFDGMEALTTSTSPSELYQTVLIATPLAPYFELCVSAKDLNDKNLQIVRNILYKAYLEDFYLFCCSEESEFDQITKEQMSKLLEFEADRAIIEIAVNSMKTGLSPSEKLALFPSIGSLSSTDISNRLAHAEDISEIQSTLVTFPSYKKVVDAVRGPLMVESGQPTNMSSSASMDDILYTMEVDLHRFSFFGQFHFANFYSFCKLKEQEIRNILWIAECIAHKQRAQINKYVPIFYFNFFL